jgi:predicted N-acetyltransferase YhbS
VASDAAAIGPLHDAAFDDSQVGLLVEAIRESVWYLPNLALVADLPAEPSSHPTYYPRLGFVRGRTIGVLPPEHLGAIDQAWMVRRRPGASAAVRGRVVYPQAFLDLD